MKVPRLAEWLMGASVDPDDREAVTGDLAEEFSAIADHEGPRRARQWYWMQTRRSLGPNLRRRLRGRFNQPRRQPDSPKEPFMTSLAQDFRFSWRMLRQRPLLMIVSMLSLVVGMTGTLVVFGLLNAAVLRPLPVADPGRVALVLEQRPSNVNHNFSYGDFREFRETQTPFTDVVAFDRGRVTLGRTGGSEILTAEIVTGAYFQLFGIRMRLGRGLGPADDDLAGPPVVVVSETLWERHNRPALEGWTIALNSQTFAVVGVAGARFAGTEIGGDTRVWAPLRFQPVLIPTSSGGNLLERPTASWLTVMGRLKPGVDFDHAGRELTRVESTLPPVPNRDRQRRLFTVPGAQGDSMLPNVVASPLQLLLAVAGLVLAVACANVAGLLVARATERERELAVRTALGASRSRLARLLLVEAGLIGAGSVVAAFGIASVATRLAVPLLSRFGETVTLDVSPDLRVFGFAAALALGSSLCFGLIPLATRRSLAPALAESSRGTSAGRGRSLVRRVLVAGQFALSLALVAVAVLLGRTFVNLRTLPTGFDLAHIAIAEVDPNAAQYSPERIEQYVRDAAARLGALPGVRGVGYARVLPLGFGGSRTSILVPGYNASADEDMEINYNVVTDGYFDAMGIALRDGRLFDGSDARNSAPVAIVNETMARRYWQGHRAVGQSFVLQPDTRLTVVGVVPDVKYRMLREDAGPSFYLPALQNRPRSGAFHVRTNGPPDAIVEVVRGTLADVDSAVPVTRARTLVDQANVNLASERLAMTIALGLTCAALLLAAVGLYAAMSHAVSQRQREIGVRLALGARPADVGRLVLRQGVTLAAVGSLAGAGLAIVLARGVEARLYGVTPGDVPSLLISIGVLSLVAMLASWIPARRAARVDPVEALRVA